MRKPGNRAKHGLTAADDMTTAIYAFNSAEPSCGAP
jgi:hypothetical protein